MYENLIINSYSFSDCGGSFTESPAEITSPGFLDNTTARNDVQCIWKIQNTARNSSIKLEFVNFNLQYDRGCLRNFVLVREGMESSWGYQLSSSRLFKYNLTLLL